MANTPLNKSLGDVLRKARVARNLSLREFAKRVGITPSYLSDIENDRRVPAEEVLRALSKELDLDFDDLMARSGRLGRQAVRYMSRMPAAGVLFRQLSEENAPEDLLEKLSETLQKELRNRRTRPDR
jgi:transcriptional regulator with XRE-family HTH domain